MSPQPRSPAPRTAHGNAAPWKRRPPGLVLRAALLLALTGCGQGDPAEGEAAKPDEGASLPLVRVEAARLGEVAATLQATATVSARTRADLAVEVAGTVQSVAVHEGDGVRRGQTLARLANPALEGELRRAEAEAARASAERERTRPLHGRGYVAQAEWDAVERAARTADDALRQARDSLAATTLDSPIAGAITAVHLRVGEAVAPGAPAFGVADLGDLLVEVHLPERDLLRLRPGLPARLLADSSGKEPIAATVERLAPVVDARTGTVKVTLAVREQGTPRLRPGMLVRAEVVAETRAGAVLVPKKALVYEDGLPLVYRVQAGKARRSPIEVGYETRDEVEVLRGVSAGDSIVTGGQAALKDGAEVRVVPAEAAPVAATSVPAAADPPAGGKSSASTPAQATP